ncbi:hypothetical protein MRB53_030253 [Persea americana]|uniref:Uncharacterized protein n=1 Tax=Persea americana TaxID=3435 RepID=A0ACC2KKN0_PERAE|nr:hypothetical protein MRB53_030253 [Persea americana]
MGYIEVGDLYADEVRDFLVCVDVPTGDADMTSLTKVSCAYKDPISKDKVNLEGQEVKIQRPENITKCSMSIEVDKQRNWLQAAEARASAEWGDLGGAVATLKSCRRALPESAAAWSSDHLCVTLGVKLKEM